MNHDEDCVAFTNDVISGCSPESGKDWSSVALYLAGGQTLHKCAALFLGEYPDATVGASDVSHDLFTGMDTGLNFRFGIDQQSYLQGYLPISFLTLAVTNNQIVGNEIIETGPSLVLQSPSLEQEACVDYNFGVCVDEESGNDEHADGNDSVAGDVPENEPDEQQTDGVHSGAPTSSSTRFYYSIGACLALLIAVLDRVV